MALGIGGQMASSQPSLNSEYLVGVDYFSGWWREQPNKYFATGVDWRTNFPERRALLGEFNEQETMDREISAAAANGVGFFQILWYYQGNPQNREQHSDKLNEGLRLFMASPKNGLMKFAVEFVNHPPFAIEDDARWDAACREWCAAMKHPSYLKVGGRPVFKVHGADFFFDQNGKDPARVEKRLETLRRIAKESGVGDPLIGGGVGAGGVAGGPVVAPYDFLTTYMEMPNLPVRAEPYPYGTLLNYAENAWTNYARLCEKPYVPYVPSGWDPRPWKDTRASYAMPTREQWAAALRDAKATLDAFPKLGLPAGPGRRQKILLIYAWNEFAEGGIVAPTKGDGTMKLDAIKSVFGAR